MPSIGIVVPNFNGAEYLQECLESVLSQSVPVQCLVMDGGSTDGSVQVLKRFGDHVRWVSERDQGQADAIRRGFEMLRTDLIGWLNSDDVLLPDAACEWTALAAQCPEAVLYHGDVVRVDAMGKEIGRSYSHGLTYDDMRSGRARTVQPGSVYRSWAVRACGGIDPSFHLLMDVDLWIKLLQVGTSAYAAKPLAKFRVHEAAKSSQRPYRYYRESLQLALLHEQDRLVRAMLRRSGRIVLNYARYVIRAGSERVVTGVRA